MSGITLGDTVPNLAVETTHDNFKPHDYFADSWTVLFSHPGDFTPVCTTELGAMAKYSHEFEKRCVKLLGLSCDDIQSHKDWIKDVEAFTPGNKVNYPIIADPNKEIILQLNMVDPIEKGITLGYTVPNLAVEKTHDNFKLHDYFTDSWTVIFSHPGDFTPIYTTELSAMAKYSHEFEKRGVKLLGLSCDDIQSHKDWIKDVEAFTLGSKVNYPIIADPNKEIIPQLNMVDPIEKGPSCALHIVGPDFKIKLSFLYPSTTGRNMDEVLRALDSLLMASKYKNKIATPVNWKQDEPVVISPAVSNEEAKETFPQGFKTTDLPSKKGYLHVVDVYGKTTKNN